MVQELSPEEIEQRAIIEAVGVMATDPNFQRFMGYVEDRVAGYVRDIGDPRCYHNPQELNNTAGRIDELRQLLSFIDDCRGE